MDNSVGVSRDNKIVPPRGCPPLTLSYLYCIKHFIYQTNVSDEVNRTNCIFQVFNIRYSEMHKVQGAKCAISKLRYGLSVCTVDNHSLKLVVYRLVHTDEPHISPLICFYIIMITRCFL